MQAEEPFTADDFAQVGALALATWQTGVDRDWSVPAGTLEWSCRKTAEHVIDSALAPAFFLASRRLDAYPLFKVTEIHPSATIPDLIDCLRAVVNVVWCVVVATDPDARAIIRRRPVPETAPAAAFAPRCGLELILHNFDIACGLGVAFDPPRDLCALLYAATFDYPREEITRTDDSWSDLLARCGRPRP
jgi:hypothetical protein